MPFLSISYRFHGCDINGFPFEWYVGRFEYLLHTMSDFGSNPVTWNERGVSGATLLSENSAGLVANVRCEYMEDVGRHV
jgi:hypothetical protein